MTVFLICLGISLFFFYESQYGISPQGFKVPCSFPAIILRDYYPIVKSLLRVLVSTVGYNSKLEGLNLLKLFLGDFPVSPAIKTLLPMQGAWVWSLVRELRSHMPQGEAKRLKKKKTISKALVTCLGFGSYLMIAAAVC